MKLLLDTHIWIWSHVEPRRMAKRVAAALTNSKNELWLSPISIWEFLLLADEGRVRIAGKATATEWVTTALGIVAMHEAPINHQVALRSRQVRLEHDDPADRFIAATAEVYDLTLVTHDNRLLKASGFRKLPNR